MAKSKYDNGVVWKNKRPWSTIATGRDTTYQKKRNRTPEEKKKRALLNKKNRELQRKGKGKKGDGRDVSHATWGKLFLEKQATNRARNWHWGGRLADGKKRRSYI